MERTERDRFVCYSRIVAGGLGLLFLLLAVLGSHWAANPIFLAKDRLLLGTVGAVLTAICVLGRAFRDAYTATAVILLNSLLLAFCVEFVSSVVAILGQNEPEPILKNVVLAARPFQQQHSLEFAESDVRQLEPYVNWTLAPYSGRTVTIDATGVRKTPGSHCAA